MALRLSTGNRIFIAGVVGAIVLCIGSCFFMAGFTWGSPLGPQLVGREKNGTPWGLYLAFTGLAVPGFATGALYAFMARGEKLTSSVMLSMASGATAGLLTFLLVSVATLASAFGGGLVEAVSEMFTDAFDTAPVFILIMLLLALFAAAGAMAHRLARHTAAKLGGRNG